MSTYRVFDPNVGQFVTPEERQANEAARQQAIAGSVGEVQRRIDQERAADRAERERNAADWQRSRGEAFERELKAQARSAFGGSDAQFQEAWPALKLQLMASRTAAEIAARQAESLRAARAAF